MDFLNLLQVVSSVISIQCVIAEVFDHVGYRCTAEELLPVVALYPKRADAIATAREACAEQQIRAEEPALPVGAVG